MKNKNEKLQNGVMKLDIDELEGVAGGYRSSDPVFDFIYLSTSSWNKSGDLPLYKVGDYVVYHNEARSCDVKAIILEVGPKSGNYCPEFEYHIQILEEGEHLNEEGWTYESQITPYYDLHKMFPTVF